MAPKDTAEKLISDSKVAVFSKSWCPYCKKVKSLLESLDASGVGIIELDEDSQGDAIQAYLGEKTGQRTVPNVFISGKHIGGSDDLAKLNSSGELKKLIAA